MSLNFVAGRPGAGKTLYAMKLLVSELVQGRRTIVTNFPIRFDGLWVYLLENYPKWCERLTARGLHLRDRFIVLEEHELKHFFCIRPGVRMPSISKEDWQNGKRSDYSVVSDSGVAYFIDEIHVAFNARDWQLVGQEVMYYLSQHRKLGDDIIAVTQSVGNVDKQFRSMAQDYTYIRNLSKERWAGFRMPGIFTRSVYLEPKVGDTSKPTETGTFTLDVKGIASCYDTAKGVGIQGKAAADIGERKSGFKWYYAPILIVGICIVVYGFAPSAIARFLFKPLAHDTKHAVLATQLAYRRSEQPGGTSPPVPAPPPVPDVVTNQAVAWGWVTGRWGPDNGRYHYYLSDGCEFWVPGDRLSGIDHFGFNLDGRRYLWVKPVH